jgi:hypothetical protein
LLFGTFGREGSLSAKILQRQAKLGVEALKFGPPPEQDIPLKIPQKTNLFVELTQRERDHCTEMHTQFQKDLQLLRLKTA